MLRDLRGERERRLERRGRRVGGEGEPRLHAAVRHDEMGGGEEVGVGEEQVAHGLPSGEVGEEVDQEGDVALERPPAQVVQLPLDGGADQDLLPEVRPEVGGAGGVDHHYGKCTFAV